MKLLTIFLLSSTYKLIVKIQRSLLVEIYHVLMDLEVIKNVKINLITENVSQVATVRCAALSVCRVGN